MIDTIATRASETPAGPDTAVAAPGFRMRWWMVVLILVLSFSSVLGGTMYSYLRFGWFESDVLGRSCNSSVSTKKGCRIAPSARGDFSRVRKGSYVSLSPTTPGPL
jgi:uncharacterized membrane protein (DUF4010 family)